MANELIVDVELELKDVKKELKQLKKDGKKAGKETGDAIGDGVANRVRLAVAGIGTIIAGALASRIVIKAAAAEQQAIQNLNTSLRLAGTFSKAASKSFQDLANQIQETTIVGNEEVLFLGALSRNFARSNEEAMALTKASIDLSAATGLTLEGSIKNLGKTLSGLTGELGESLPQIKLFTAEQLKAGAAIQLIADRFGGAAQQQVNTFSGAIAQATNNFSEILKSFGRFVTESPAVIGLINKLSKEFSDLAKSINKIRPQDVFGPMINAVVAFGLAINTFIVVPFELAINLVKSGVNLLRSLFGIFALRIGSLAQKLVNFFSPDSELNQNLKIFVQGFSAIMGDVQKDFDESLNKIFDFDIAARSANFIESFAFLGQQIREGLGNNVGGAAEDLSFTFSNIFDSISSEMKTFNGTVKIFAKQISGTLKNGIGTAAGNAFAAFGKAVASGENALDAFVNAFLASMGQMAVQLGTQFILQGTALFFAGFPNGPPLIAAGAALAAFGGVLSALAPSGAGAGAAASAGIGGGVEGPSVPDITDDLDEGGEEGSRVGTRVTVNIQGSILDRRESGLAIVEVLQEFFDTNDGPVTVT